MSQYVLACVNAGTNAPILDPATPSVSPVSSYETPNDPTDTTATSSAPRTCSNRCAPKACRGLRLRQRAQGSLTLHSLPHDTLGRTFPHSGRPRLAVVSRTDSNESRRDATVTTGSHRARSSLWDDRHVAGGFTLAVWVESLASRLTIAPAPQTAGRAWSLSTEASPEGRPSEGAREGTRG